MCNLKTSDDLHFHRVDKEKINNEDMRQFKLQKVKSQNIYINKDILIDSKRINDH